MKRTRFDLLVIALVLTFAAIGCRKNPDNVTIIPGQHAHVGTEENPGMLPGGPGTNPETVNTDDKGNVPLFPPHTGWAENADIFKAHTVYFDYDSAAVKSSEQLKVSLVAAHLKSNPELAVRVEGNCDERGTEEYNRSLGERRALASRETLITLGIEPARVETKSWGEDNPGNDHGHDEAAWRQNRRDEFILLTPPPK